MQIQVLESQLKRESMLLQQSLSSPEESVLGKY